MSSGNDSRPAADGGERTQTPARAAPPRRPGAPASRFVVADPVRDPGAIPGTDDGGELVAPDGEEPTSIELGPAGAPLGLGTAADFDAEALDQEAEATQAAAVAQAAAPALGAPSVVAPTTATAK